jgi:hypothetical protein
MAGHPPVEVYQDVHALLVHEFSCSKRCCRGKILQYIIQILRYIILYTFKSCKIKNGIF